MTKETIGLFCLLVLMGAGWGLTQPLSKIAVSEGYRHFGLIFWQFTLGASVLWVVQRVRGIPFRTDPPAVLVYVVIALIGTLVPNASSFEAMRHLPSGLVSILLALVPMFAFPIALALGNERFAMKRLLGLCFGLLGVLLIVAPEASLPEAAMAAFVPLAIVPALCYGFEGNIVARWGTAGMSAIEVLLGASLAGLFLCLPLIWATGSFVSPLTAWNAPEFAIVASSLIHVAVYTGYVWMVGRAGPVFAVQVSYLVTGFGVVWAMLILGERYSGWVWAAMGLMMVGMFLVQPRPSGKIQFAAPEETDQKHPNG
jgi:drug/metabolite transporter (DMT)-like permease